MYLTFNQNISLDTIADKIATCMDTKDIAAFVMRILNSAKQLEVDENVLAVVYKGVKECYEVDNEPLDLDHLVKIYCKE